MVFLLFPWQINQNFKNTTIKKKHRLIDINFDSVQELVKMNEKGA